MGCKYEFFPSAFVIISMSIGHSVAPERVTMMAIDIVELFVW